MKDVRNQTPLLIGMLLVFSISTASAQRVNPTPAAGVPTSSTPRPAPSSAEMRLEDALLASKWTITILAPGQKPWGDLRFNSDGTFSSMNGFAGDWKKTAPRTVGLGGTGISLTFDERFEKFEGFDAAGKRHSAGAKLVPAPVAATVPATPAPAPPARATPAPSTTTARLATPPMVGTSSARKPPVGVPADAQYFDGKWYRVYTDECPWSDAKQRCEARYGGRLAVIPDARTWEFVRKMTNERWFWLGATNEAPGGEWKWIDGTPMTFTAWAGGQPDSVGGREHYLHTGLGDDGGWNDAPKDGKLGRRRVAGYVCEWRDR